MNPPPGLEARALRRSAGLTTLLQCAMVLLGLGFPVLERMNLFPIVGTLLAVLAGYLFARWAPGRLPPALVGGALAGGISSLLGVLLAALTGPADLFTVLVAALTGLVAGGVGGFFGRLFERPRPLPRPRPPS